MILKDLLELMDDDEEITVSISFEDAELDKDKPTYVTGAVWATPWRFVNKEIQSVSEYNDKLSIVVKDK